MRTVLEWVCGKLSFLFIFLYPCQATTKIFRLRLLDVSLLDVKVSSELKHPGNVITCGSALISALMRKVEVKETKVISGSLPRAQCSVQSDRMRVGPWAQTCFICRSRCSSSVLSRS